MQCQKLLAKEGVYQSTCRAVSSENDMNDAKEAGAVSEAGRYSTSIVLGLIAFLLVGSTGVCAEWPQFRGENRDGKSADTGLLKEWPAEGPELLWAVEELGHGYASVAVTGGSLYTVGMEDKTAYLYACDLDGNLKWKRPYGPAWTGSVPGARNTPTSNDGLVYVMNGYGRVVCFDASTGEEKWAVDVGERFGGRDTAGFGFTESPLVDGDKLICTPGGQNAGIVALNKKTGETVWVCDELDEKSGYCSPIAVQRGSLRIIVTLTGESLVGIDAETGKLLSRHPHDGFSGIHAVSPVYEDGRIYITSGNGGPRGEMLELSEDGTSMTRKWSDSKLDCYHGGVIVHDGYVYGTSDLNSGGNWICLNLKTGEVAGEIAGVGEGSIAYADGMLYCYGENGMVGLTKASPTDFRLISSFRVGKPNDEHWAHPVVADGRLYIRHGKALMAYDIKAD